jgi:hypothetical protein
LRNKPYKSRWIKAKGSDDEYFVSLRVREKTAITNKLFEDDQSLEVHFEPFEKVRLESRAWAQDTGGVKASFVDPMTIFHTGSHFLRLRLTTGAHQQGLCLGEEFSSEPKTNTIYLKLQESVIIVDVAVNSPPNLQVVARRALTQQTANGSSSLAPQGDMSQAAEANPQVITAETNRESFDSSAMDAPTAAAETFEVRCRVTLAPCSTTDSYDGLLGGADLYETSHNINPLMPKVKVRSTNPPGRRPPLTPFSTGSCPHVLRIPMMVYSETSTRSQLSR